MRADPKIWGDWRTETIALIIQIISIILGFWKDTQTGILVSLIVSLLTVLKIQMYTWYNNQISSISNIYKSKQKISDRKDDDFIDAAKLIEYNFNKELEELISGVLVYNLIEDYTEAVTKQIDRAKLMRATVLIEPDHFNEGGQLHEYYIKQVKNVKIRRLKVKRIFLFDDDRIKSKYGKKFLTDQVNDGIEVFSLDPDLCEILEAFVIFDDDVVFAISKLVYGSRGRTMTVGKKITSEVQVQRYIREFVRLEQLAEPYPKPKKRYGEQDNDDRVELFWG